MNTTDLPLPLLFSEKFVRILIEEIYKDEEIRLIIYSKLGPHYVINTILNVETNPTIRKLAANMVEDTVDKGLIEIAKGIDK